MPLLRSKVAKSSNIETADGILKFNKDGILISHPQGNKVLIGPNGIEFSCSGMSMKMTASEILLSTGAVSLRMQMTECSITAGGNIRVNGSTVNVNNGALEVI